MTAPKTALRKPEWLKIKIQGGRPFQEVEELLRSLHLNTVCQEANCPNRMECYGKRTATFIILGRNCTRNCTFCNVSRELPDPVDPLEPAHVARAVRSLKLRHAVVTSVTRDDLPDQGAEQFAACVREIRAQCPETTIELLIPDMQGREDLLDIILAERPDVLNHNVETVPSLYHKVRPQADFERSLAVLRYAKSKGFKTKSGIMVGLGEREDEVIAVMERLREGDCDMLTVGQYLQPTAQHIAVYEYVTPETFERYRAKALELGFARVASGPFVRSSYKAEAL
ncbi:lipoyl synthase [Fretibacterium sp. OH1220_COT-178]|uniref:lipoyl synthase n=1 Tax=Fretibacterium sp. OH1220_COT-178 TaxID=2491047 RepID=UPI000F5EF589|nr:lipoyl synthase [Fretibacterium sp. OH1220_COT-178]RRD64208.1 lipoyl synthase [Fretibacterium sp. OH1220_COT-178]